MLRVEHGEESEYGARLITTEPLAPGQLIARLADYRQVRRPTYLSIQIGPETHIEHLGLLAYLNHSCAPNTIVDTEALTVTAARAIAAGEELTFFYPSTEWDMVCPFACLCGAADCLGAVSGAKPLSAETLGRYFINRHIRAMVEGARRA